MGKVGELNKPATCITYIQLIWHICFTTGPLKPLYDQEWKEILKDKDLTLKIDNFKFWAQIKGLRLSDTVTNRVNCQNVTRHGKKITISSKLLIRKRFKGYCSESIMLFF